MDVHLRDLRYFVAVAEELHFTRAAERLFVSQPALSRQIAKLERDLRVELLRRDRRSVVLTAAGAVCLERARDLLADWDRTQRDVNDAAVSEHAVLRVGQQTSVGRGFVEGLVSFLRIRRPTWRIEINQVPWTDPTAGLADGTSDVALCWLPLLEPGAFHAHVLASETIMIALPASHALAVERELRFADIADEPLVALPEEAGALRDHWLAVHARDGRPAPVASVAMTADQTLETVAAGIGSALISKGNAALYPRPGIAFVPVADLPPSKLALVWRRGDNRDVVRDVADYATAITHPRS